MNGSQLTLLDRIVEGRFLGDSREDVLRGVVLEEVKYLMGRGSGTTADATRIVVNQPTYGPARLDNVLHPVTGTAVPVYSGEVLRISQVEGGTCVDFNGYNLHDYKEWLDCGFNRQRGETGGDGTLMWSGAPRARPMYAVLASSPGFATYINGHRCNGISQEVEYGLPEHPNCQDTFAEAIREYGLTPDDVHDSYNLWMKVTVTPDGQRIQHWNRAVAGDRLDLLALFDTLAVPVICGGDISFINNFGARPIRVQVFAATPSTDDIVRAVRERFGTLKTQQTPERFRQPNIRVDRELRRDESYVPAYRPIAKRETVEVEFPPEVLVLLRKLVETGNYLVSEEQALQACLARWYARSHPHDHIRAKLEFVAK